MPKEKKQKKISDVKHSQSLGEQIVKSSELKTKSRQQAEKNKEKPQPTTNFVSPSLSKKILSEARQQLHEKDYDDPDLVDDEVIVEEVEESETEEEFKADDFQEYEAFLREEETESEANTEDLKLLERFMPKQTASSEPKRTLADYIMEKLEQQKEEMEMGENQSSQPKMNPKVIQVYTQVGKALSKYTSGKVPKAFKIIGSLKNWEEVLYLTSPDKWSPAAFFQATKLFASNLNSHMAQRFYNLILLPKVRDDIQEHKKLNFHLYMSLKKALFKPAAFYKGIVLPLCESGDCTLREALIISSVLSKVSIPVLHSSAALLKLCQMEYSGSQSIFIKKLLDKKYSLPMKVVTAIFEHFIQFLNVPPSMPVLWHQALLVFVQRYKNDMNKEHREFMKALLHQHPHPQISEEIRRELFYSQPSTSTSKNK